MKKLLLLLVAVLVSSATIEAKEPTKRDQNLTTTQFVTNIDCPNCTKKVMNVLPNQKGVKDVDVNLERQTITVTYDKRKSSDEAIEKCLNRLDVKVLKPAPQHKK